MFQGKLFAIKTIFNGGIIAFFDLLMTYHFNITKKNPENFKFQLFMVLQFFFSDCYCFGIKVRKIVPKIRFPLLFLFVSKIFMTKQSEK